jgi:hypothetical protein
VSPLPCRLDIIFDLKMEYLINNPGKIFFGTMPSQHCARKRNVRSVIAESFVFAAKREDAWSKKYSEHQ